MKIEIYGDGCARCKGLRKQVQQIADELGIKADISTVMDPEKIAELGAISLPQMTLDGELVSVKQLSSAKRIKELLDATSDQTTK